MDLQGTRRALLVGADEYSSSSLPPLPGVAASLNDLREVLLHPEIGGYLSARTLFNKSATAMTREIVHLCASAAQDETLFLYFVGHGLIDRDGTLFLALTKSEGVDGPSVASLSMTFVTNQLSRSDAHGAIVVLDCVYSGGTGVSPEHTPQPISQPPIAVLAGSRSPDPASQPSEFPVLTRFLINGLRTGTADSDGDGLVEVGELYAYLHDEMLARGSERPTLSRRGDQPLYIAKAPAKAQPVEGTLTGTVPPVEAQFAGAVKIAPEPAQAREEAREAPISPASESDSPASPAERTDESADDDVEWVSDAPATMDLLRREALADVFALRLTEINRDEPGTSILAHLDGAWGTGKSTLLNLLEQRLQRNFLVTRFDAWRQSRVAPPWWSLLAATRAEIVRSKGWWGARWLRVRETIARARRSGAPYLLAAASLLLIGSMIWYLLRPDQITAKSLAELIQLLPALIGAIGLLGGGLLVAGRFLLWDSARGARLFEQSDTNPMAEVAAHFAWLIDRSEKPLVFFIDDLDRCQHEYVVEFLEAVQTLVRRFPTTSRLREKSRPHTAAHFVIAADGAWLRRSYEVAYQTFDESVTEPARPLGHLFLDKLFQLTVPMPELSATAQSDYLDRMLRITGRQADGLRQEVAQAKQDLAGHHGDENAILDTLDSYTPQVKDLVAGDAALAIAQPETRQRTNHSLQKFATMLHANPRSMKKFLNTYSMLRSVRTLEGNTVPTDTLALWAILLVRWPALAEHLARDPDAVNAILDPLWVNEAFPDHLREVARSADVRAVVGCKEGGALTPALIRQCRGLGESG